MDLGRRKEKGEAGKGNRDFDEAWLVAGLALPPLFRRRGYPDVPALGYPTYKCALHFVQSGFAPFLGGLFASPGWSITTRYPGGTMRGMNPSRAWWLYCPEYSLGKGFSILHGLVEVYWRSSGQYMRITVQAHPFPL